MRSGEHQNGIVFKKTKWTPEEDRLLRESIAKNGTTNWTIVASVLPGRSGKQCRERWMNQLDPNLNKEDWKPADDVLLFTKHSCFGNSWVTISKFFPGRSPNSIKNRWSWLTRHHFNPFQAVLGKPIDQGKIIEILNSCQIKAPFINGNLLPTNDSNTNENNNKSESTALNEDFAVESSSLSNSSQTFTLNNFPQLNELNLDDKDDLDIINLDIPYDGLSDSKFCFFNLEEQPSADLLSFVDTYQF